MGRAVGAMVVCMNNKHITWHRRALCVGLDPKLFDARMDCNGWFEPEQVRADALCRGCPVKRECAREALKDNARGVIRAGVAIPINAGQSFTQNNRWKLVHCELERVARA